MIYDVFTEAGKVLADIYTHYLNHKIILAEIELDEEVSKMGYESLFKFDYNGELRKRKRKIEEEVMKKMELCS